MVKRTVPEGFSLVRYFAGISLACIVLAALALGWFYRQLSIRDLTALAEDRNCASSWP